MSDHARALGVAAGTVVIVVGVTVLGGWLIDSTTLKSLSPVFASMKANTALCFLLAGTSLLLRCQIVVEDEPQLRQIITRMLERHKYRVRAIENPLDAVELLAADGPVALLLTDVVMPGMSGLQLAKRATELRPELPILFMSAFPQDMWGARRNRSRSSAHREAV
jgi:hypothetical protein